MSSCAPSLITHICVAFICIVAIVFMMSERNFIFYNYFSCCCCCSFCFYSVVSSLPLAIFHGFVSMFIFHFYIPTRNCLYMFLNVWLVAKTIMRMVSKKRRRRRKKKFSISVCCVVLFVVDGVKFVSK